MPVSQSLLDLGKFFDDGETQTLGKTEPKEKPKHKISSKLLDVGKRIEYLDKELFPSEQEQAEGGNKIVGYDKNHKPIKMTDKEIAERTGSQADSMIAMEQEKTPFNTAIAESTKVPGVPPPITTDHLLNTTPRNPLTPEQQTEGRNNLLKGLEDYQKETNVFGVPNAIAMQMEHEKKVNENPYLMTTKEANDYFTQHENQSRDMLVASRNMLKDISCYRSISKYVIISCRSGRLSFCSCK